MSGPASPHSLLGELSDLSSGSRAAALAGGSGTPLVAWGAAWALGYCCLAWVAEPWGAVAAMACLVAATAVSWLRRSGVRSGWEARIRGGWLLVLGLSPALVSTVTPISGEQLMLFLGALWSLAMALYAVAVRDRALVALMAAATVVAGLASHQGAIEPLGLFGLVAGGATAAFGCVRRARAGGTR